MRNISDSKTIFWDFDGVIMDSMPTRTKGFSSVLKDFPSEQVDALIDFHNKNGGLSRYVKFRYFFEQIRGETISDEKVMHYARIFSEIMLNTLMDKSLLIADSLQFIKINYVRYEMHIVSGSDGDELKKICHAIDIDKYFKSINGSPTPKTRLVEYLLIEQNYNKNDVILVGDSINDYEACTNNGISFAGYNNPSLATLGELYIESFENI